MDLGIKGKSALISGGTAGIGNAVATALAREGCNVTIVGRSAERAEKALARLQETATGEVTAVAADMTDNDGVAHAVDSARKAFGPVDIVLTNVIGHVINPKDDGPPPGHFDTVDPEEFGAEFKQLVLSALSVIRLTLPDMKTRNWGRVINICSGVARESAWELPHILPNTVRPSAAGLHRLYSRACVGTGVTFNALLTGSIETERNLAYVTWLASERGITLDEARKAITKGVPLERSGKPEEMAAMAAFLCSNAASGVNGQAIPMVGGSSRHIF